MINVSPVISVIVPVYNVEKYLARCLDSILDQSFHDIEIICVNDGSHDSSLDILHTYARKDQRIRIIDQENRGIAAARNAGLDAATGHWISFVDSDDIVLPNIYENLLSQCPDSAEAICFSAQEKCDADGSQKIFKSKYFEVKFSGLVVMEDDDLLKLSATVWDKLYLREKIEELGLRFPEGIWYEDNAFVWNYFAICRKTFFVKDKLYLYCRHEGSFITKSRSRTEGMALHYIAIIKVIHHFWQTHGLFPASQPVFEKLSLFLFRAAIGSCNPWETAGIIYMMSLFLRDCSFQPENRYLYYLQEGTYDVYLGSFPCKKDIHNLRTLHGFKKIFQMGNSGPYKIIMIFCIVIFKWKRKIFNG